MGNGIYWDTLYVHIWRTEMQGMHRNINKEDGRLKECLEICIDSLDWIKENSSLHAPNRHRAKDTLKEIKRILGK